MDDPTEFYIPAFMYKLYEKGTNGLKMAAVGGSDVRLYSYDKDPVLKSMAVSIDLKEHHYQVNIQIPEEYITSSNMFLVIMPVWMEFGNDYEPIDPHYIHITSMSRVVHYSETEFLRIGCDSFNDLSKPISMPTTWESETRSNQTLLFKLGDNAYSTTDIATMTKVRRESTSLAEPIYVYQKNTISQTKNITSSQFKGLLSEDFAAHVMDRFENSAAGTVLAYNDRQMVMAFPGSSCLVLKARCLAGS